MTAVRFVDMRERHPTGIGQQCEEFVRRMSPRSDFRRHRLRHVEVVVRGLPRFGYLSVFANRLVPVRRSDGEVLHAGDMSLVPFLSDPFDIVEAWDTIPFERFDLYQRDLVSAWTLASWIPGVLKAGTIVAHSPSAAIDIRSFFGRKPVVIPAGVDTDFFDIDPAVVKEPRSVLAIAAYYPQKNLVNLAKGCAEAGDVTLRLIGRRRDDDTQRAIEAVARNHGNLRLETLGYVDRNRLRAEYNRAAVYCSASTREGFGVTPVEAMACGTLPVLSDIPAHRDTAGDVAEFFDPTDIHDIGDAIGRGLDRRSERGILRQATLPYSWPYVIGAWSDLYRSFGVDVRPVDPIYEERHLRLARMTE